ncbi:MAG: class I adenylate-forming enzyme family protein [Pseudomonadota bacterium]
MTLLYEWLDRVATDLGNAKALVYRDNYLSWRGLLHRVERRAQEFHSMGVRPGDLVGLMLGNVPDFVILSLALSRNGATIVPIDPTTASQEFELMLETVPLRALITRPRGSDIQNPAPTARTRAPTTGPVYPPDERKRGTEAAESRRRLQGTLLVCSTFRRPPAELPTIPEVVMFTADSAGDPKAVLRSRENLEAEAEKVTHALDLNQETTILAAMPLFHAYGWDLGLLAAMRHGATLYVEEEMSARRICRILREQEVDVLPGTPFLFGGLTKMPAVKPRKQKGVRFISAGSILEESVAETFHRRHSIRLMSAYHTTETGLVALDGSGKYPDSVGKVVDGIGIRLTNSEGKKARQTDERSVIWAKGDSVALGSMGPYEIPPARCGRIAVGGHDAKGWYRTGDLGRLDKNGRLHLQGREDDLVKVDGKRVALCEVEGCVESFPKVKQAQAFIVEDPLAGPMVVVRVISSAKCRPEEIIDHCAKNLAPYKVPRRIEFCDRL